MIPQVAGESLKRRIAHDRPIAEKCFHIIADDCPIAEKCFHTIAGSIFSNPMTVSNHMETRLKKCDTPSVTSVSSRQNVANWHNGKF